MSQVLHTSDASEDHHDYKGLLKGIQTSYNVMSRHGPIFTTDVDTEQLYQLYLDNLPQDLRQHHTCRSCEHFIKRFGSLAVIDDNNLVQSLLFSGGSGIYEAGWTEMEQRVQKANINGVFFAAKNVIGQPVANGWEHFSAKLLPEHVYSTVGKKDSLEQKIASYLHRFQTFSSAINQFQLKHLQTAQTIITSEALARSEKFLGPINFLVDIKTYLTNTRSVKLRHNYLWKQIAQAPEGYCFPRASVIGSLLEDIEAGLTFKNIERKFNAKLHPLQYQRAQVAPSLGNIKRGEEIIEKMGLARSLERRYAAMSEVPKIWTPTKTTDTRTGVFAGLRAKNNVGATVNGMQLAPTKITWVKFEEKYLNSATEIELNLPMRGNYTGITTAVHSDAPPIMKYDNLEQRNPFSQYLYHGGSSPNQWSFKDKTNQYLPVVGVCKLPNQFYSDKFDHLAIGRILLLEDGIDQTNASNALFAEVLIKELFEIRSTIEAYSKNNKLQNVNEMRACGLLIGNKENHVNIRAKINGVTMMFNIDRWD